MKTIAKIFCLVLLLGALSSGRAAAQGGDTPAPATMPQPGEDLKFDRLGVEQGLSEGRVWGITQDRRGFMWFATYDGINRYDGYEFKVYKHDPEEANSPGGSQFQTVLEDRAGWLWFGSWDSGLSRFDPETEQWQRYRHDPDDPHSLSSNSVWTLYEDRAGVLWVGADGGGLSRFDPETGSFTHYRHDPDDPDSLSSDTVLAIHEDEAGSLWIGTTGGLNRFDRATGRFTRYQHDPSDPHSLSDNEVFTIYQDRAGVMWLGTWSGGLERFDPETGSFTHHRHDPDDPDSLSNDSVTFVHEDQAGRLWIGTYGGGLNQLNRETEEFTHYRHDSGDPRSLSHDVVASMYEDRAGLLWIGTGSGGINKLDPHRKGFNLYQHQPTDPNSLSGNDVRAIYSDSSGGLWIGTHGAALNHLDRTTGTFTHFASDPRTSHSLSDNNIACLYQDRAGLLWIGTWSGGLNRFDPETGSFTHYRHDPTDPDTLSSDTTIAIHEDSAGAFWIGTWSGGLNRLDRATGQFERYLHQPEDPHSLSGNIVPSIYEDRGGTLWIGTLGGGLNRFEPESGTFTRYRVDPDDPHSLSNNTIWVIHQDQEGVLWLGTGGGGLNRFDLARERFKHYSVGDGLPNDTVYGILADGEGYLWLSTSGGLSRFDPRTETFRNYDVHDGLPGNTFQFLAYHKGSNDEMFFGSPNGLVSFFPRDMADNPYVPPVVVTAFEINNRSVEVGPNSALERSILATDALTLSDQDRILTFEFAALNYSATPKNRYRYILEGFDSNWTEVDGARRRVTYTNLDPGQYVFRVVGSNNDGVWNEAGTSIKLSIRPPWWETLWFRATALLLVVGLIYGGYRRRLSMVESQRLKLELQVDERTRELAASNRQLQQANEALTRAVAERQQAEKALQRAHNQLEQRVEERTAELAKANASLKAEIAKRQRMEEKLKQYRHRLEVLVEARTAALQAEIAERERVEEALRRAKEAAEAANRAKSAFLANMSHELRTPLNAILGLTQVMQGDPGMPSPQRENLNIIGKSGEHLLELINDVLEMTRIEAGRSTLNPVSFDLHHSLDSLVEMMRLRAEKKGLGLSLKRAAEVPRYVKTDERKLRQVLINLLGNAIKFTEEGQVMLRVSCGEGAVRHNGATSDSLLSTPSALLHFEVEDSGAGIAPEYMGRLFEPFSQTPGGQQRGEGTGLGLAISRQFVQLMGGDISAQSQVGQGSIFAFDIRFEREAAPASEPERPAQRPAGLAPNQPEYRILVVDDSADNRALLQLLLEDMGFTVQEAVNGEQALERHQSWQPHLIWLDLRMPGLDGYEVSRRIKANREQETVIVAVTASLFEEERAKVLAAGCDDLVHKPFRPQEIFDKMAQHLGVHYIYEVLEPVEASGQTPATLELTPADLTALPGEWVAELRQAASRGRSELVIELIDQIKPEHTLVAESLTELVDHYQFRKLVTLTEQVAK